MDLTLDTVDVFERVPVLFGEWSNEDFESTIAVVVEPCGNCPEEHCGYVFVVMRTVGHPKARFRPLFGSRPSRAPGPGAA